MKINFVYMGTDLSRKFEINELISHESNKDATGRAPCYAYIIFAEQSNCHQL